jgi:CHAT domain-containing protein/tetratricopeptide (TPR) repeat protein
MLRVAMPPVGPEGTGDLLQSIMSRLLSAPGVAGAPAKGLAQAVPGLSSRPLTPVVRLAVDGGADVLAGRHADAERKLAECKRLAAQQNDSLGSAACSNNLALALAAQGRHAQARAELELALQQYDATRVPPTDAKVPLEAQAVINHANAGLPAVLALMSPEQRAQWEAQWRAQQPELQGKLLAPAQTVWHQAERLNTSRGRERTRLNLGNLALATGRLGDAESMLRKAFEERTPGEDQACRAAAATDLARLLQRLGRSEESRTLLARYRTEPTPDTDLTAFEMGAISLASARGGETGDVATIRAKPSLSAAGRRDPMEADLFKEPAGRFSDDALTALWTQAAGQAADPARPQHLQAWRRLALRAAAGRRPDMQFAAHSQLMRLQLALGNPTPAILHGKRAVQVAQAGRTALEDKSPSRDARRAFLRERRQVYVQLAQLLLDAQRLQEAEAVLQLLKEDEGQQFITPGTSTKMGELSLTPGERDLVVRDEADALRLRQAEQGRVAAAAALPLGAGALLMVTPEQIEVVRLKYGLSLASLPAQLRRRPLVVPTGVPDAPDMLRELRSFLIGPERRIEKFLTHLVEDADQFTPPVGAQDLTRLSDSLKRVRQIQAELAPLLRDEALAKAAPGWVASAPGARPRADADATDAWHFVVAEPSERMWRSMRAADALEAQHVRDAADRETRTLALAQTTPSDAGGRDQVTTLLASQTQPTALLYYLPGDDRVDVLLVSAKGRRHWRLALARAELESQVDAFVQLMRRTERDPRPAAQALYARLFAPVAQAVADSGAQVIALSLAGKLRFVPFAALHDGKGWLVERYALALHPGGPLGDRLKPASANWRVAAFGASEGAGEFPPLLSVRGEIGSVVRRSGESQGVLPGESWLDKDFTAKRLRAALGSGAHVVHIASHFKFVGGDAQASYLLLGDGGKLSLRELAGADYRFDRTELVTLSACTTGPSADDTYGQEVDGLAALLMGQGAPSVLASLWEVNDRSTATLMGTLYRLREGGQLSRAFALQQAQRAMIRTAGSSSPQAQDGDAKARGVTRIRLPGDAEPDPEDSIGAPPAALGYGHPFHWAAFVLMGNWR